MCSGTPFAYIDAERCVQCPSGEFCVASDQPEPRGARGGVGGERHIPRVCCVVVAARA